MIDAKGSSRRSKRGLLGLIAAPLAVICLWVALLAFPQLIVSKHVRAGTVVLYYDGDRSADIDRLAADVDKRLRGSGYCDSTRSSRVFFFRNHGLYSVFARLSRVTPLAQGFGLSVFGSSFVSGPRVTALTERNHGLPKYSVWEGDPAHTIAHEIGHHCMIGRIGRGAWKRLPRWKQEGFPEYVANVAAMREDSSATLSNRFSVLQDDGIWGGSRGWDRIHYEAGLLVEYLLDVRGYDLDRIVADSVTREETLAELASWCEERSR